MWDKNSHKANGCAVLEGQLRVPRLCNRKRGWKRGHVLQSISNSTRGIFESEFRNTKAWNGWKMPCVSKKLERIKLDY